MILTKSGAKLLDFGLAKTSGPAVATSGLSMLPTTPPATMTAAGTILGTFQYMAPEQIEGLDADARTDLFAFGCVLYEMLTGRKAFEGKTRASLLGAILKDEPPPVSQGISLAPSPSTRARPELVEGERSVRTGRSKSEPDARGSTSSPRADMLDRIVATCLAKDPDDRWQSARDLMRELQWIADGASAVAADASRATASPRASLALSIVATAVAAAAVAGVAVWALTRTPPVPRPIVRFQATPPATAPLLLDVVAPDLAFSADGTRLAYIAGTGQAQLYIRQLDQTDATPLAGVVNVRGPFFSPDGEWVGYFQASDLKKVSVRGGPSVTICTECAGANRGATWGADDTIVFSAGGGSQGLRRVSGAGGDSVTLTTVDSQKGEQAHRWPEFLPGGQVILFTIVAGGTIENALVAVRNLKTGAQTIVVRGGSHAHYVPTGHLVYGVGGTLRVVGFDLSQLSVIGNPVPALEHVVMKATGATDFGVSPDGSLAYISGDVQGGGQRLVWIDRQGHEEPIAAPPRGYVYPRLSPDGQRVALDTRDQQNDIWVWDFSRGVLTRLTTDPGVDQYPVWTPDGRRIAYASTRAGAPNVFWQPADGTGVAERLTTNTLIQYPWAFTPDGKSLVFRNTDPKTGPDVSVMSVEGDRAPKALIHTPFNESNAELSPDGRWIAYQSNESGRDEIHVRPFPAVEGGHWQISTDGGTKPLWARSGRELFYVDPRGRIMAVAVQAAQTFTAGNPGGAIDRAGAGIVDSSGVGGVLIGAPGRNYDVSPDGRRFLVIQNATRADDKSSPLQLNVVLNWGEELKRLAPVKR